MYDASIDQSIVGGDLGGFEMILDEELGILAVQT